MQKALIVVDMQNDFLLPTGSLFIGHDTTDFRKRVAEYVKNFKGKVFYTKDTHKEYDPEFDLFPEHCIRYKWGNDLVEELVGDPLPPLHILEKKSFALPEVLVREYLCIFDEVEIIGVCSHICISDIAAQIINIAKNQGSTIPHVTILKYLVDDFDMVMAEFSLDRLQRLYGVRVI